MLKEYLKFLFTPCSRLASRFGYLREAIAIDERYRRNRAAWAGHLENCKALVLEAARQCRASGQAVVLGSGLLLDLPLPELSASFERVVLVDLVHLPRVRRLARELGNVSCLEADLTGLLAGLPGSLDPERLAKGPDLSFGTASPDLVISLNVLSQLPHLPLEALAKANVLDEAQREELARAVLRGHLNWLNSLQSMVCLISDVAWQSLDSCEIRVCDPFYGLKLEAKGRDWAWDIAPRPEVSPDFDRRNLVRGRIFQPGEKLCFLTESERT